MTKLENEFPISWVRSKFPAVIKAEAEDPPFAFFDNAGGTQVPDNVIIATQRYFTDHNVNLHAKYARSEQNVDLVNRMRGKMATFLGADSSHEIICGLNATTIMRLFATSFRETLSPGDELIVTSLDHEANITPWLRLQLDGVKVKFWEPRGEAALLEPGDLKALLSNKTRLVAVTAASNVLGTIIDCREIADLVHDVGAVLFVDGVHVSLHLRTNVTRDDIDVFTCSGYKIFGPHIGFSACKKEILDGMPSLNHFFLNDLKLEIGTQNFEGLAAMEGMLEYFDELAGQLEIDEQPPYDDIYQAVGEYERMLFECLLTGLQRINGVTVYGITDPGKYDRRVATVAFSVGDLHPDEVSAHLGKAGFGLQQGHMYAARIVDWLRLSNKGGVVRAGLCHYNTVEEIDRLLAAIKSFL